MTVTEGLGFRELVSSAMKSATGLRSVRTGRNSSCCSGLENEHFIGEEIHAATVATDSKEFCISEFYFTSGKDSNNSRKFLEGDLGIDKFLKDARAWSDEVQELHAVDRLRVLETGFKHEIVEVIDLNKCG